MAAADEQGGLSWHSCEQAIVALGEPVDTTQLEALNAQLAQFVRCAPPPHAAPRRCPLIPPHAPRAFSSQCNPPVPLAATRENEDPRTSPHLRAAAPAPDGLDALASLLARKELRSTPTALLGVRAAKVLARRQDVRLRCSRHCLHVLASLLDVCDGDGGGGCDGHEPPSIAVELAAEAANALSNLSYESANASGLAKAGGAALLLRLLLDPSCGAAHLLVSGAVQTLAFQADGRAALLKAGGVAVVLGRLASMQRCTADDSTSTADDDKLQLRLAGALHNFSSSAEGVAAIRRQGGVAAVARLLASPHAGVPAAAAAALQNLSLEGRARADIRAQPGALAALASLLVGADTQVGGVGRFSRGNCMAASVRRWVRAHERRTLCPCRRLCAPRAPCAAWQRRACKAAMPATPPMAALPQPRSKPWSTPWPPRSRGELCSTAWGSGTRRSKTGR